VERIEAGEGWNGGYLQTVKKPLQERYKNIFCWCVHL